MQGRCGKTSIDSSYDSQYDESESEEFYNSDLFDEMMNLLINDGLKVGIFEVEKYICWGTPNDLKTYEYWKKFFTEDYDKH